MESNAKKFGLVKNDSDDIGFCSACLLRDAITFDEFQDWFYLVLSASDNVPDYFFVVLDMKSRSEYLRSEFEVLGFMPSWNASEDDGIALEGIAFLRNREHSSDFVTRDIATEKLQTNPRILDRYKATFPFIDLDNWFEI